MYEFLGMLAFLSIVAVILAGVNVVGAWRLRRRRRTAYRKQIESYSRRSGA